MAQLDFADVIANIEVRIMFPGGQADIERRRDHALAIAGNKRQLGCNEAAAGGEWNAALEYVHRGNVKGGAFSFQIKKNGVAPGKALDFWFRHNSLICSRGDWPPTGGKLLLIAVRHGSSQQKHTFTPSLSLRGMKPTFSDE